MFIYGHVYQIAIITDAHTDGYYKHKKHVGSGQKYGSLSDRVFRYWYCLPSYGYSLGFCRKFYGENGVK